MKNVFKRFIKILISFIKKLFHKIEIIPIDEKVDGIIDLKIAAHKKRASEESEFYQAKLKSLLNTYFSKKYATRAEMGIAYAIADKEWRKLVKTVNSTNKFVTLDKNAFEKQSISIINNLTNKT